MWLAPAPVRGLVPLEPHLRLRRGKVPAGLLALALVAMSGDPVWEMFAAVVWDGEEHRLIIPPQERGSCHVQYEPVPGTVVGVHSHGRMGDFFSGTDDADDQGLLVSVVLGHLDQPFVQARARLCTYGHFAPVRLAEVFQGTLPVLEEGVETG